MISSIFRSSGDLIADRRYAFGHELEARGDIADAADLYRQAVERAPRFVAAWFALGQAREKLGQRAHAIAAFRRARELDVEDRHGAGLQLARLGADEMPPAMPPAYVRALFDQYAQRFDAALTEALSYRAPALLFSAVEAACGAGGRPPRFGAMLDLGCGTGLGGAAFRAHVDRLAGVDLSAGMIEQARAKALYDRLIVLDLLQFLDSEAASGGRYDLILAADVFAYFADLAAVAAASARVLYAGGVIAFTVETHPGDGVVLGDKLRYAHGKAHVRAALAGAGLTLLSLAEAATRTEAGLPVPGLVAVARRD